MLFNIVLVCLKVDVSFKTQIFVEKQSIACQANTHKKKMSEKNAVP